MISSGKKVKIKCPKCGSNNFTTAETYETTIECTVVDGIFPERANDHIVGGIVRVECRCDECDHSWKPRKVKQITDIIDSE